MGKHKKRTRSEDRKEETKKLRRELRDLKDLVMQCLAAKSRDDASNRDAYDSDDSINEEDPPSDVDSQDIREDARDPEAPQTPETGAKNGSPDRPGDTGSAPETTSQAAPAQQEDTTTGTKTPTESVSQKNKEPEGAPSLNEEVIKIIGKPPETEEACQKIHPDVSVRWNAWLKSGLKKEEKDELLKNYPRGGSCLLEAPILNPEIASTLNESAPKRDKYFCATQKLAGSSLSALAPAITLLLENETVDSKTILTNIWDAAKILAELHHSQSVARRAYILPSLTKQVASSLEESQFGKLERPVSNSRTDHLDGPEIQISEVGNSPEDTFETVQPEQNEPDPESGLSSSALVQQQQHQQQIEDSLSDQQIQVSPPGEKIWSSQETSDIQKEIDRLLSIGAIEKCWDTADQFLSSYFLREKPDGSKRFILNLQELNLFINTEHFKLEDLRSACRLLDRYMYMGSVDIKDAYFAIPIHKSRRKYLRFKFQGQVYEFTCLPFGLCESPYVFTKLMKPVMSYLRQKGFLSVIYLDDILCLENSIKECEKSLQSTISLLEKLGFIANRKKSNLSPSQHCKYLGFILNSRDMLVELPREKRNSLIAQVGSLRNKKTCKIRKFAQIIGTLVASCPGVDYGMLHCKLLEKAKLEALEHSRMNYDARMDIPGYIADDLKWWHNKLPTAVRKIRNFQFQMEIFSDASLSGWGAFCGGEGAHGIWSQAEKALHINHLEIKAAFLALKLFAKDLVSAEILLRIDNTTAIAYINKLGGTRSEDLHDLARKLWDWCEQRDLWVHASYIASKDNVEADSLSRLSNRDTEWQLANYAFKSVTRKFGVPEIDLFASNENKKCAIYCSWDRDPKALAIDAFTVNWNPWFFYAFPPFATIAKAIQKIKADKAVGILIVPFWPSQNWFPAFKKMRHGTSTEQKPYPGGREIIRQALLNKNTSEESAEIMIASVENSTLKQYESSYKLWWEFNQETQSDPFSITAKKGLSFLTKRFQDGASYGTINSGKAALALIAREEIANSDLINRFMRGVYKKRPGRPRYDTIWDVDPVLDKLAEWYPLEPLKLKKVTKKLVLLLALGTAHRIQTLAAIKISNIIETQKGLEIKIPEHIKTSRAGAVQPLLKLPFFEHKPGLCIARTLLHYLTITKDLRGKEDYLLISFQKPHAKVSRDTIGRWIKSTLRELGVDERYTAHSTRHAATSKAAEKGVNIDEIKRIAGWSQKSKVFADFYNLPIKIQDDDFAKRVMLT
ncbi:uncharacterized protein [Neodiprion pinetum]|uniref:uncharacterized protein n=1 Tax=Neodiprion pinetum TaxID=441929 RepID=UPI00371D1CE0